MERGTFCMPSSATELWAYETTFGCIRASRWALSTYFDSGSQESWTQFLPEMPETQLGIFGIPSPCSTTNVWICLILNRTFILVSNGYFIDSCYRSFTYPSIWELLTGDASNWNRELLQAKHVFYHWDMAKQQERTLVQGTPSLEFCFQ